MGRESSQHQRKTFLNIVAGKIAEKVDKGSEGAIERFSEKKNGNVYEKLDDSLSGIINNFEIRTNTFGSVQLEISIVDVMDNFNLSIPVDSRYFDSFCSKIMNADLNAEIKIAPYDFEPKDSGRKIGINLFQGSDLKQKLGYYFSKEHPHGKPQPENFGTLNSKGMLDDEDYKIFKIKERKFYKAMIEKLNESLGVRKQPQTEDSAPGENDLPF